MVTDGKIVYTIDLRENLGLISPYLFAERLKEAIEIEIIDSRVFISHLEQNGVILLECKLPQNFAMSNCASIKSKIDNMAESLKQKLTQQSYFAKSLYKSASL